jgi:hypothetical protein
MRSLIVLVVCSMLMASCGGSRVLQQPPDAATVAATPAPPAASDPELEDPLALLVREVEIPEHEWKLPEARQYSDMPEALQAAVADTSEDAMTQGWRVQLGALQSQVQASEEMLNAQEAFDEDIYLVFDAPLYKIRVGDCLTRERAEDLLSRAIRARYRDAWIIPTDVFVNRGRADWLSGLEEEEAPEEGESGTPEEVQQ